MGGGRLGPPAERAPSHADGWWAGMHALAAFAVCVKTLLTLYGWHGFRPPNSQLPRQGRAANAWPGKAFFSPAASCADSGGWLYCHAPSRPPASAPNAPVISCGGAWWYELWVASTCEGDPHDVLARSMSCRYHLRARRPWRREHTATVWLPTTLKTVHLVPCTCSWLKQSSVWAEAGNAASRPG